MLTAVLLHLRLHKSFWKGYHSYDKPIMVIKPQVQVQDNEVYTDSQWTGGFYDFTSDLSSKDTAYTSIALEAHTDTTYFTDPAGLQMFHLLSHEDGSGGASLLVDGYRAARILYDESREDYHQLQAHLVPYHASGNDGISIMSLERFPVLRTRRFPTGEYNQPYQIRWNNADRAAFETPHTKDYMLWYKAARKWVEILRRPDSEYWTQLAPGRPLSKHSA